MAHVVELFGAPGTGKSSVARALDGRRVDGRRLVAAQRLARVPRTGPLGLLKRRDLTPAERRAALAARRDDWAELLELIAGSPRGAPDPIRALHAPGWLAASLELRALADAAPSDMVVVRDEGLVQRVPVVCGVDPDQALLERYLRLLPPALHLHLVVDAPVLAPRIRGRPRVIDRHRGLGDFELSASLAADVVLLARCSDLLSASGAAVRTVRTDRDIDETVDEVIAAVRGSLPSMRSG